MPIEVVAIVEGQTEQLFVRDVLGPHLSRLGIEMWAILSGRVGRSGGVKNWRSMQNDILNNLTRRGRYCTMMFDYYGMPDDWPGRLSSIHQPRGERGAFVEKALASEIHRIALAEEIRRVDPRRFIPYVQMHEFEALLFSNVDILNRMAASISGRRYFDSSSLAQALVAADGNPEAINDNYETCPSRRIIAQSPMYRKRLHGSRIAAHIGLQGIRSRCARFNRWLGTLESLTSS